MVVRLPNEPSRWPTCRGYTELVLGGATCKRLRHIDKFETHEAENMNVTARARYSRGVFLGTHTTWLRSAGEEVMDVLFLGPSWRNVQMRLRVWWRFRHFPLVIDFVLIGSAVTSLWRWSGCLKGRDPASSFSPSTSSLPQSTSTSHPLDPIDRTHSPTVISPTDIHFS